MLARLAELAKDAAPVRMGAALGPEMERLARAAPRTWRERAVVAGEAEQGDLAAKQQARLLRDRVEDAIEVPKRRDDQADAL